MNESLLTGSTKPFHEVDYGQLVPDIEPVAHFTLDGVQRLIVGLCAILIIVITVLMVQVGSLVSSLNDVQTTQSEAQIRGYKQRAVSCQALSYSVATEALPDVCLEEEVLAYYNPDEILVADEGGGL